MLAPFDAPVLGQFGEVLADCAIRPDFPARPEEKRPSMQNYFYSSVAGIALVVHLIIHWRQLVDWRGVKSRQAALEFRHFLVSLLCFFSYFIYQFFKCHRNSSVMFVDYRLT